MNENSLRISESYSFKVKTLEASEEESSNMLVFGSVFVFGILAAAYIYRNYSYYDDDYEDEEDYEGETQYQDLDDFDNTAQPEVVEAAPVPQISDPEPQPPVGIAEVPQVLEAPVADPISEVSNDVPTRRKWFGLFGPKIPIDLPAAEPTAIQPVAAAEPIVAQPVAAEPVVAQPVAAEPVVAQPIVAEAVVVTEPEDET